jgi:hypothetical protein
MAHFYFHLSAPGEYFADNVGYDVSDPGAVHYIALRLADRVMRFVPFFQNRALDFRLLDRESYRRPATSSDDRDVFPPGSNAVPEMMARRQNCPCPLGVRNRHPQGKRRRTLYPKSRHALKR